MTEQLPKQPNIPDQDLPANFSVTTENGSEYRVVNNNLNYKGQNLEVISSSITDGCLKVVYKKADSIVAEGQDTLTTTKVTSVSIG